MAKTWQPCWWYSQKKVTRNLFSMVTNMARMTSQAHQRYEVVHHEISCLISCHLSIQEAYQGGGEGWETLCTAHAMLANVKQLPRQDIK